MKQEGNLVRLHTIIEKKYELLRFWLLGTWIAKKQDLSFENGARLH
ncbi:unnamed protein product, partial [marine sediment metagenome]